MRQSQISCARPKDDFHIVSSVFVSAGGALKFNSIFGLTQNIWTGTKHFGSRKTTKHKSREGDLGDLGELYEKQSSAIKGFKCVIGLVIGDFSYKYNRIKHF